jgi:hypothetical protein
MSKKTRIAVAVVPLAAVALGAAVWQFTMSGPRATDFEYLREPQLRILPDLKVLEVQAKGDPEAVGSQAFGLLFKTYYRLTGVPKGPKQPAPRARWPVSLETPKSEWVGRYAIPVPPNVEVLPSQGDAEAGLHVEITTWPYGDVAEMLHVGPYEREEPTIAELTQFIKDCHCEIVGEHEEEYLKGPGLFSKGNPEKYLTIIRYRVKKVE